MEEYFIMKCEVLTFQDIKDEYLYLNDDLTEELESLNLVDEFMKELETRSRYEEPCDLEEFIYQVINDILDENRES